MDTVQVEPRGVGPIAIAMNNGDTTSREIDLEGYDLVGFILPANFQGAAITFTAAEKSNGTHQPVSDSAGAAISLTVAASKTVVFTAAHAAALKGLRFIKFITGSAQNASIVIFILRKQGA